jgi:hypothetical protein
MFSGSGSSVPMGTARVSRNCHVAGYLDLEVLKASEAKNCDLLIEIGGRMDEVCESCHKVLSDYCGAGKRAAACGSRRLPAS